MRAAHPLAFEQRVDYVLTHAKRQLRGLVSSIEV
jgi:hypothetical protein